MNGRQQKLFGAHDVQICSYGIMSVVLQMFCFDSLGGDSILESLHLLNLLNLKYFRIWLVMLYFEYEHAILLLLLAWWYLEWGKL